MNYELPLNEVVFDFYDRLKSMTSGYGSFDYEIVDHREGDLVKLGILVNNEPVDALSIMIHNLTGIVFVYHYLLEASIIVTGPGAIMRYPDVTLILIFNFMSRLLFGRNINQTGKHQIWMNYLIRLSTPPRVRVKQAVF